MEGRNSETAAKETTIRTVGWASRMRLGARDGACEPCGSCEPCDQGFCADLDERDGCGSAPSFGVRSSASSSVASNVAREILAVVRSLLPRTEAADARIRVEIDPMAAIIPGGPVGTVLYGMLQRAVDARAHAAATGAATPESAEIALCVRIDGPWLRIHVLDSVAEQGVMRCSAAVGLASATAQSLGGTLEMSNVPFGPGTLLSAAIPVCRLAYNSEDAA